MVHFHIALALLFFISLVNANTESLLLVFPDDDNWSADPTNTVVISLDNKNISDSVLSPDSTIQSTLIVNHLNNRELKFLNQQSSNGEKAQVLYVKIDKYNADYKYNLRVCWPATYPVSIDIAPKFLKNNDEKQAFLEIAYYPKYYSSNQDVMLHDLQVPIEVHMVSLLFGVIPIDIQPVIALIISVLVISIPLTTKILDFIENST